MEEQMEKLSAIAQAKPYKIIISKPAGGEIPYRRIVIERKESYYQAAAYTEKQVFHENIPPEKLAEYLGKTAVGQYLQVNAWDDAAEHIYLCSKKGKVTYKTKKKVQTAAKASGSHNRKKQYILEEGTPIEPLVDMGVFTPEEKSCARCMTSSGRSTVFWRWSVMRSGTIHQKHFTSLILAVENLT